MAYLPHKYKRPGGVSVTIADIDLVAQRYQRTDYPIPKYIQFCKKALESGYNVKLYEAQHTVSKYVTVCHGKKRFKVRFSNHKPIPEKELQGTCDFFVGITNYKITTTNEAWETMKKYFDEGLDE